MTDDYCVSMWVLSFFLTNESFIFCWGPFYYIYIYIFYINLFNFSFFFYFYTFFKYSFDDLESTKFNWFLSLAIAKLD